MALMGIRVLSSAEAHYPACLAADGAMAPVGSPEYEEYVAARLHSNDGCYVTHVESDDVEGLTGTEVVVPDGLQTVLGTFKALPRVPGMKTVEAVLFARPTTILPGDALQRYWYSEAWEVTLREAAIAGREAGGLAGELWRGPYGPVLTELRAELIARGEI